MEKAYHVFLMIELAKVHDIIPKELEYDEQWAKGQQLFDSFRGSQYDDENLPEYECIEAFLEAEPTQENIAEAAEIYNNLPSDTKVLEVLHDLLAERYGRP